MDPSENKPTPYVNWSTRQLVSWLDGLDDVMKVYVPEIESRGLTGKWINSVTPGELQKLGIVKVGHQMFIMDRVRQLQTQYISFDTETLQTVLFRVSRQCVCITAAVNSLMSIIERQDSRDPDADSAYPGIADDLLDGISHVLRCILALMSATLNAAFWLERPPFLLSDLGMFRQFLLESALACNRCAQSAIANQSNLHFKGMLDYVDIMRTRVEEFLQNFGDSILLTPCTMELVQIRKLDNAEFGFNFYTTTHNVHVVMSVQSDSAASRSGKINKGDELVEVNDQIVIGWQHQRVADLIRLHTKRITLRLRKRPAHVSDFTGLPGAGRRHRVANPNPLSSSMLPQHAGGAYLQTRTTKRRAPPVSQRTSEPLPGTQESSEQVINYSRTPSSTHLSTIHSPLAASSSSLCPSLHLNDSPQTRSDVHDTVTCSTLRMASSTPNTPLMTVRGTANSDNKKLSEPHLCTRNDSKESLEASSIGSSRPGNEGDSVSIVSTPAQSNTLILPQFFLTHRRATSGDPNLFNTPIVQSGHRSSVIGLHTNTPRLQALDKRSRIKSGKGSTEDTRSYRKQIASAGKPCKFGSLLLLFSSFVSVTFNFVSAEQTSCKELGQGNCEGWLWLKKSTPLTSKYVRRWCVFKESTLCYYRTPETECADGSVHVLGFTITPASDVKSGRYPFHMFNDSVRLIFASDSEVDRSKWMNILGLAAIGVSVALRSSRIGGFNPGYVTNQEHAHSKQHVDSPPYSTTTAAGSVTIVSTISNEGYQTSSSVTKQDLKTILIARSPRLSTENLTNSMTQFLYGASDSGSNLSLSSTPRSSSGHAASSPFKCVSVPTVIHFDKTHDDGNTANETLNDQKITVPCDSVSTDNSRTSHLSVSLPPRYSSSNPYAPSLNEMGQVQTLPSEISSLSVKADSTSSAEYFRRHSLSPSPRTAPRLRRANPVRPRNHKTPPLNE